VIFYSDLSHSGDVLKHKTYNMNRLSTFHSLLCGKEFSSR